MKITYQNNFFQSQVECGTSLWPKTTTSYFLSSSFQAKKTLKFQYLWIVMAARSLSVWVDIGVTVAKPVYSSVFLFESGVLGFSDGYISLLDLTSFWTPLDVITPLSFNEWEDVPTIPSPQDATAMFGLLLDVAELVFGAGGWVGANKVEIWSRLIFLMLVNISLKWNSNICRKHIKYNLGN